MAQAPQPQTITPKELRTPTEDQVHMSATIGQRIDKKGTKVEDEAGTGKIDSDGG
jgi:hypothetical protein